MKTLIVEDDFTSRLLLQKFLSSYGECHVAVNGREAVDAFRKAGEGDGRYDLVCMDILMPQMDGHAAARRIRSLEQARGVLPSEGAKIIMTTSVADMKQVIQSFQELCDAYLVKPVDLGALLNHLKAFKLVQ